MVTGANGAKLQVSEFTFLRLYGMGVSPIVFPTLRMFELSVTQP